MTRQIELISDLQQSELSRFQTMDELYTTRTKNPIGLRFSNLERAFNIVAASKFVGWPEPLDKNLFFKSVCAAIRDYIGGPYIADLPQEYRIEFEDPLTAESWFDFTRTSLYLSLIGKCEDALQHVTGWVKLGMRPDPGIEDVSSAINVLYEHICCLLREERLPISFLEKFRAERPKKREQCLADMVIAISERDKNSFLSALTSFLGTWHRNTQTAVMHDVLSVDASVLCGAWQHFNGTLREDAFASDAVHVTR